MGKWIGSCCAIALSACTAAPGESRGVNLPVEVTPAARMAIEQAVRARLVDPDSARFGVVMAAQKSDGAIIACGSFNAKNSFGGMAGETMFMAGLAGDHVVDLAIARRENSAAFVAVCRDSNIPM